LTLGKVVNRADCGIAEDEDVSHGYAVLGVLLAGESVVNFGGAGAVMGMKPSSRRPESDVFSPRGVFMGDGRRALESGGSSMHS
jgi:hypothetical protein